MARSRIRPSRARLDRPLGSTADPGFKRRAIREQPQLALRRATAEEAESFTASAAEMLFRVYRVRVEPELVLAVPGSRVAMSTLTACVLSPSDGLRPPAPWQMP